MIGITREWRRERETHPLRTNWIIAKPHWDELNHFLTWFTYTVCTTDLVGWWWKGVSFSIPMNVGETCWKTWWWKDLHRCRVVLDTIRTSEFCEHFRRVGWNRPQRFFSFSSTKFWGKDNTFKIYIISKLYSRLSLPFNSLRINCQISFLPLTWSNWIQDKILHPTKMYALNICKPFSFLHTIFTQCYELELIVCRKRI